MGILSVNIVDFAMNQAAYLNPMALGRASISDLALWAVNMLVVDGKFRSLFSMLFGASMLLVIDRAEAAGQSGLVTHLRRMAALLFIGLVHAILIWRGDILTLYAMAGIVASLFARSSVEKMLVWAGMLAIMHIVLFAAITATVAPGSRRPFGHGSARISPMECQCRLFFAGRRHRPRQAIYDGGWPGIAAYMVKAAGIFSTSGADADTLA